MIRKNENIIYKNKNKKTESIIIMNKMNIKLKQKQKQRQKQKQKQKQNQNQNQRQENKLNYIINRRTIDQNQLIPKRNYKIKNTINTNHNITQNNAHNIHIHKPNNINSIKKLILMLIINNVNPSMHGVNNNQTLNKYHYQ